MQKKSRKRRNQRGSIALFVLLSLLFFLVIVTSVGVSSKNKVGNIEAQYKQIKAKYEQEVGNEEQIYQEKVKQQEEQNVEVKLIVDPNGGKWNGTTAKSTVVKDAEDQINLDTPTPPTVTYDADGGTAGKTSETAVFNKWELTGKGALSGNIYSFGEGTGTVTAKYNTIKLTTATKDGYNFARMV